MRGLALKRSELEVAKFTRGRIIEVLPKAEHPIHVLAYGAVSEYAVLKPLPSRM